MGYCSVEDVQVCMQQAFSATSQPTETQIETLIDYVSSRINLVLKQVGVSLPVIDTDVLNYLKIVASNGVACQVSTSYFQNQQSVSGTPSNFWCSTFETLLKEIQESPELVGASTGDDTSDIVGAIDYLPVPENEKKYIEGRRTW